MENQLKFSVRNTMDKAWDALFDNPKTFFAAIIMTVAAGWLFELIEPLGIRMIENGDVGASTAFMLLSVLIAAIVFPIISLGIVNISLIASRGMKPTLHDFVAIRKWKNIFMFIGIMLLTVILSGLGLIFLIIPGVILYIAFMFALYLYVDNQSLGMWTTLKKSFQLTKGYRWKMFQVLIMILLIKFAGLAIFGVGIIVAEPFTWLILAYSYCELKSLKQGAEEKTE